MAKKGNKFFWGLGIGAALGLLFAPRKGDETREKVSKDLSDLKEALEEALEKGEEKYQEIRGDVSPKVERIKEKAKPYVESLKKGLEGEELKNNKE